MLSFLNTIWTQASSNTEDKSSQSILPIMWPTFKVGGKLLFTAPVIDQKPSKVIDLDDTIQWRWQENGQLHAESFDSTIDQFMTHVYKEDFAPVSVHAITSKSIADQYAMKASMPREVMDLLYETRQREIVALFDKAIIELNDIENLDRGARGVVANDLWNRCSPQARESLLNDVHHMVRAYSSVTDAQTPVYIYEVTLDGYRVEDETTHDCIKFVKSTLDEAGINLWMQRHGFTKEINGAVTQVQCIDVQMGTDFTLPQEIHDFKSWTRT